MSAEHQSDSGPGADKKSRREELKRRWMEKRAAEEGAQRSTSSENPLEKVIDTALTPTYIAVGAAIIAYRKLTGKPSVTVEDFE